MCSDDELHALSGPELLERTRELVAERNRIDAELARTVRTAENKQACVADGMTSARSWLKGHCRLSGGETARVVRNGRVMEQLPAVAEAHASGKISADEVSEIGKITAPRPVALAAAQGVDLTETAEIMSRLACVAKHEDLATAVHTFLQMLDTDGPEPDPTEQRALTFTRHADGSITGRFHLDPMGRRESAVGVGVDPAGQPPRR
jgi:hypothetical protein